MVSSEKTSQKKKPQKVTKKDGTQYEFSIWQRSSMQLVSFKSDVLLKRIEKGLAQYTMHALPLPELSSIKNKIFENCSVRIFVVKGDKKDSISY